MENYIITATYSVIYLDDTAFSVVKNMPRIFRNDIMFMDTTEPEVIDILKILNKYKEE